MEDVWRMMENEYRHNRCFREYVDRYCNEYGCTVEEALKHYPVRMAFLYLTDV